MSSNSTEVDVNKNITNEVNSTNSDVQNNGANNSEQHYNQYVPCNCQIN